MTREKKEFQFPYTNRGVGHTLENGLRACVDWLEVTFKTIDTSQLITDILQMDPDSFYLGRGDYGYRRSVRNGAIAINFDGNADMGVHLIMRGRACREYESYDKQSWKGLFETMLSHQASFSRLDIAVDDFKGFFTIKGIVRKIKSKQLISKFRRARNVEDIDIREGEVKGVTIYYGAPTSDIQIKMYDKFSERTDNNYRVPEGITFWNRTEIQLRNARAQSVAETLATGEDGELTVGQTVCGILKHYLRFTVKGTDSNRSRWKTAPFWKKFLGKVDELPLTTIMAEQTVQEKEMWLRNQAAPSLAVLYQAYDGDMEQIEQLVKDGIQRLKAKDHDMIKRFQEQKKEPS